jgi:enoyl-CoA hydratase/carnithine racemase
MNYKNFKIDVDADGIALVTWDMPGRSMNVFDEGALREMDKIVEQVTKDAEIKGAVITSGKDSFSGGADLKMLQELLSEFARDKSKDLEKATQALFDGAGGMTGVWRKLETCGKPWVAAINGTCMGGAFELALACHGRVAADSEKVKMALPEVKVGIFPGAGGTQRVPRLTDTQSALQMLTTGQTLSPQKAKSMGLIHQIADPENLIAAAKGMIKGGLKPVQPWDEKGFKLPGGQVYSPAGFNLWPPAIAILRRETGGNYPAAAAILKCVYEGLLVPFDMALRIEQRYFTKIMQTKEAAAMIRSLFISLQELNKGARRPEGVPETKFKKIGILGGGGFMGAGIGYVTAKAGIPVVLLDRDMASAEKGKAHSENLITEAMKKGRATQDDKDKLLVATHAHERLCRSGWLRSRHRSGVRGFGSEEGRHRKGRGRAEVVGDLRLQHLDHSDHRSGEEFVAAEEFHRHPFLLAGRQDDAGRDHHGQEDRRQGGGDCARLCARDQEDADRRQRHARLLHVRCVLRYMSEGQQDADRRRACGDDRERRQDGRHAGRPAGADRRDGDRPLPRRS